MVATSPLAVGSTSLGLPMVLYRLLPLIYSAKCDEVAPTASLCSALWRDTTHPDAEQRVGVHAAISLDRCIGRVVLLQTI